MKKHVIKHISEKNVTEWSVMCSDEDQPVYNEVLVGINKKLHLIVSIEHINYDDPRNNCSTWAELSTYETLRLARRLKVKPLNLPDFISECMAEDWAYIVNPSLQDTRECFKEITECLLDEGCHFRIKRIADDMNGVCY